MKMQKNKLRKRKFNKIVFFSFLLIFIICICIILIFSLSKKTLNKKINNNTISTTIIETKMENIIHVVAMGDMLAHDTIIANAKVDDSYDFTKYFQYIRPIYSNADIVFCNQEGLSSGEDYGISGYPSFNAPIKFSADLQSGAGCNMINLANNHMGDKGVSATNATIDNWKSLNPLFLGGANKSVDEQNTISYATVNGIKVSFLAFADFNNNTDTPSYSINIYHDETLVRNLVTQARSNSDVVIVSMHWGIEDSPNISDDQINQVNLLSSLGVDVIIGTGPHVLQTVQTVNRPDGGKTVVWYSLGNMLSSQLSIQELIGGIASFDIIKSTDGSISITNLSFTPTYMHYEWTAEQAVNGDLSARTNVMIYLLSNASEPLSRSLFNTSVAEQNQYVIDTLGPEVTIK